MEQRLIWFFFQGSHGGKRVGNKKIASMSKILKFSLVSFPFSSIESVQNDPSFGAQNEHYDPTYHYFKPQNCENESQKYLEYSHGQKAPHHLPHNKNAPILKSASGKIVKKPEKMNPSQLIECLLPNLAYEITEFGSRYYLFF